MNIVHFIIIMKVSYEMMKHRRATAEIVDSLLLHLSLFYFWYCRWYFAIHLSTWFTFAYACYIWFGVFRSILFSRLSTPSQVMWFVLVAKISVCVVCVFMYERQVFAFIYIYRTSIQYSHIRDNIANKKHANKIFTLISDFQAHFENLKYHRSPMLLSTKRVYKMSVACEQHFVFVEFATHTIKFKTFIWYVFETKYQIIRNFSSLARVHHIAFGA